MRDSEVRARDEPRTSIRRGLVFGSIVLIVAAFVVCAISIYVLIYRPLLRSTISLDMHRASEKVAGDVQSIFSRLEAIAARSRAWGEAGLINFDDLHGLNILIGPLFSANASITSSAIAQDTGREILIASSPQGGGWFDRLTDPDVSGKAAQFLTWSAQGELLRKEEREVDYDARQRPWYIGVMAQPEATAIYWTPPYKFLSTQELGISAVIRWNARDGHKYAMTTDMTLVDLSHFTQSIAVGHSGIAAVLTDDGMVLGAPRDPRLETATAVRAALLKRVDELGVAPLATAFATWQSRGRVTDAVFRFEITDVPWLAAFEPIHLANQTFWVVTLAPAADFGALSGGTWALGLIIVLGSLGAASLGAIWLGRHFAAPIERLTAESERIGEIGLETPINVRSRIREIDALAQSLENMRLKLAHAHAELEAKAALEKQLQQAQKLEALGELAGGIAHDFNNILGAILGFAGFLLEDLPAKSREHQYAQRIMKAGQSAKDLIAQILIFAKRGHVERKPLDLAALLREASELLRGVLPPPTKLSIDIDGGPMIASVNRAQFDQLLLNLCVNANDAFAGAAGAISISLKHAQPRETDLTRARASRSDFALVEPGGYAVLGALAPGQSYARIDVADNGPGMEDAVLARIFEPFFTTKERRRGTGLGLAVVRGIVIAYGGACIVTSHPGAGTRFSIYLPLTTVPDGASAPVDAPQPKLMHHPRILLVDDDEAMTEMLASGLRRLGFAVTSVTDPREALTIFRDSPDEWDVVISDHLMPHIKGTDLFEEMKSIRPSVCFILVSGFDAGAAEYCRAAGIAAWFAKPVSPQEISAVIERLLRERNHARGEGVGRLI